MTQHDRDRRGVGRDAAVQRHRRSVELAPGGLYVEVTDSDLVQVGVQVGRSQRILLSRSHRVCETPDNSCPGLRGIGRSPACAHWQSVGLRLVIAQGCRYRVEHHLVRNARTQRTRRFGVEPELNSAALEALPATRMLPPMKTMRLILVSISGFIRSARRYWSSARGPGWIAGMMLDFGDELVDRVARASCVVSLLPGRNHAAASCAKAPM